MTVTMVTVMVVRPCVRACAWGHHNGCWPGDAVRGQGGGGRLGQEAPPAAHQKVLGRRALSPAGSPAPGTRCGPRPFDALCLLMYFMAYIFCVSRFCTMMHTWGGRRGRVSTAAGPAAQQARQEPPELCLWRDASPQATAEHPARHKAPRPGGRAAARGSGDTVQSTQKGNMMPGGHSSGRGAGARQLAPPVSEGAQPAEPLISAQINLRLGLWPSAKQE